MKKILSVITAAITLTACNSATNANAEKNTEQKALVIYYSQTGATKTVAEELKAQLNADIEALELENPYDGDFAQTISRCQKEMAAGELPTLKPVKSDIGAYDIIFIGYPVWFGTYASPISALLKTQQFEGKRIVTFCTFGSGGLQTSTKNMKDALPKAEVTEGYGVRNARINAVKEELNRFLIEGGYKEGEIAPLPAFMEHKPVTAEETAIFNEACSDYQFPLGTPVDVAVRETANSTDYEFTAQSKDQKGNASNATIYVTKKKDSNSKAEFTQVVR